MRVIDPGHIFALDHLDGDGVSMLHFVKRIGAKFPGNAPPGREGTTSQEVLRALIARTRYVDAQAPHAANSTVVRALREALLALEERAADVRGDRQALTNCTTPSIAGLEDAPTCKTCGHVACTQHLRSTSQPSAKDPQ